MVRGSQGAIRSPLAAALCAALFASAARADEPDATQTSCELTVGVRITAVANHKPSVAGTVVPIDWPDQSVELLSKETTNCKARIVSAKGAGAMLLVQAGPLRAGAKAKATYRYRVTTTFAPPPSEEDFPSEQPAVSRRLRSYLRPSPGIDSADPKIRELSERLADGKENAFEHATAFCDWTRSEIAYREMAFTSASQALSTRVGDCEEKASLFVALCRAAGIPARTVWSPGHAWAECFLVDAEGEGHWIAADPSLPVPFGAVGRPGPILQKGDSVRIPVRGGKPVRLLNDWYRVYDPAPKVEFIQEVRPASRSERPG